MLNRNHYLRFTESVSVLLVDDIEDHEGYEAQDYKIALHDNNLLIVSDNEIQVQ